MIILQDYIENGIRSVRAIPEGVCSRQIDLTIKDGIIVDVAYTRGCNGNLKGIGSLLKGMPVSDAIERLDGIHCGNKNTSCPDQLAQVLKSL